MKLYLPLLLSFLSGCFQIFGQNTLATVSPSQTNSHKDFIAELNNADQALFRQFLNVYDNYIAKHPLDISAKIERCKFIGNAFYNEYDEYDPNYEQNQECIEDLISRYPENKTVQLYYAINYYDEKVEVYKYNLTNEIQRDEDAWRGVPIWELFEHLANLESYQNEIKAKDYALRAQELNDTLDLSIIIANGLIAEGSNKKAYEHLIKNFDPNDFGYTNNRKGQILLELGYTKKALEFLVAAELKDSTYVNNQGMAKILVSNQQFDLAREYLIKDTIGKWDKTYSQTVLFKHDLKYSSKEDLALSYLALRDNGLQADFLGIYKLQQFLKAPFKAFKLRDIATPIIWLLLFFLIGLLAALIVSPTAVFGQFLKKKGIRIKSNLSDMFSLQHFFWIIVVYCLSTLFAYAFYDYDLFNNIIGSYFSDSFLVDGEIAGTPLSMIAFMLFSLLGTLMVVGLKNLRTLFKGKWSVTHTILYAFLGFIVIRFFTSIYVFISGTSLGLDYFVTLESLINEINSLIANYGILFTWLFVGLLAPFYEEIMFRGVILAAIDKHIGFWIANIVQALLFASIHWDLNVLVIHTFFGLVLGYIRKKGGSLSACVLIHIANNSLVLLIFYFMRNYINI